MPWRFGHVSAKKIIPRINDSGNAITDPVSSNRGRLVVKLCMWRLQKRPVFTDSMRYFDIFAHGIARQKFRPFFCFETLTPKCDPSPRTNRNFNHLAGFNEPPDSPGRHQHGCVSIAQMCHSKQFGVCTSPFWHAIGAVEGAQYPANFWLVF